MDPAERNHFPVSWRTICLLVTVAVSSASARESGEVILSDLAPPTMNAHLAECYETLLRNTDRLCTEAKDQRNKVLTSALSKCLFGRVGLWKTEQCHHDTTPAPKFEDLIDVHGSGSLECLQLKTYKSSAIYGTVLTNLLSACAMKESTQLMVEASVASAIANRTESILPAKDLEELLRLAQRVDAVFSLVLEHSSWINMIFYYSGLATLLTIITKHPSSQHYRWQLFGIIVFTIIAEKFLSHIVLLVVDVYSSKIVLNLIQWTVRYAGLATTAIFFLRNISLNISFTRQSTTTFVPSAREQETDLVFTDSEQWERRTADETTNNFVVVRVPETAVVPLVQILRMFPNLAMFRDPYIGLSNHAAEQVAISAVSPAVILGTNPVTVLGTNPTTVIGTNPATVLGTNPATFLGTNPATVLGTNPATVLDTNPATVLDTNPATVPGTNPATVLGTNPATVLGTNPATVLGTNPATVLGTNPATVLGTNPATVPGTNPATVPGTNPATVLGTNPATTLAACPTKIIPVNPAAIVPAISAISATTCAENGATDDDGTNTADEDGSAALSDDSTDSPTPKSPKQSEAYLSWDGYTMSLLLNRSLPDKSDVDDVDYNSPGDTTSTRGSSEDDEDDDGCGVTPDELDGLLNDQKDEMNATVTAETMSLSYTGGTYTRVDRTIRE